ncbi:hypothetical protein OPV22_010614 [Ensete ventricosum]|uniref:Uncharacterized protein n=1 Tax=Ensete ventricosum TaxID=4639 RepID=A0AAV8RG01_ENSVE|nr:hypothetical protein OPV22_010614 [Ensete ventricosum]
MRETNRERGESDLNPGASAARYRSLPSVAALVLATATGARGFCLPGVAPADFHPEDTIVDRCRKILGEVLGGDLNKNSPYVMYQSVCRIALVDKGAKDFKEKIEDYTHLSVIRITNQTFQGLWDLSEVKPYSVKHLMEW